MLARNKISLKIYTLLYWFHDAEAFLFFASHLNKNLIKWIKNERKKKKEKILKLSRFFGKIRNS